MRAGAWIARTALALLVGFAVTGCSDPKIGEGKASLTIVTVYDETGPYYTSGAVQEYELRLGDQRLEPTWDSTTGFHGFNDLPESDDYEIVAAQRPCSDTCQNSIGERRDECRLDLEIDKPATAIIATWQAGEPCTFKEIDTDDL